MDENTFQKAVQRRLNNTVGEHTAQFLSLTFNFASTAMIYSGTAGVFGYVYLGGYFATTLYSGITRKVHDYQFQHEIGICVAPESGQIAKITHIAKWLLHL